MAGAIPSDRLSAAVAPSVGIVDHLAVPPPQAPGRPFPSTRSAHVVSEETLTISG